jgi:hypothetical protein
MLKVVHDEAEPNEASGSVLDEIVREAARQMLAVALQAEVSAYIDAHAEEADENGHRLVVRTWNVDLSGERRRNQRRPVSRLEVLSRNLPGHSRPPAWGCNPDFWCEARNVAAHSGHR